MANETVSLRSYNSFECFICMESTDEEVVNIRDLNLEGNCQCNAKLHRTCYQRWVNENNSCPLCRTQNQLVLPIPYIVDELPEYIIFRNNNNIRNKNNCLETTFISAFVFGLLSLIVIIFDSR